MHNNRFVLFAAIPSIFNPSAYEPPSGDTTTAECSTSADDANKSSDTEQTLKIELLQGEIAEMKSTINSLRGELSALHSEMQRVKAENVHLKENSMICHNDESVQNLELELLSADNDIFSSISFGITPEQQSEMDNIRRHNAELTTTNASLRRRNDQLKSINDRLTKVLMDKDQLTDKLNAHITKMHEHNQRMQRKLEHFEKQNINEKNTK